MLRKVAPLVGLCLALAILVSCGSTASHFVYVALPGTDSGAIAGYREAGSSGVLTAVPNSPFTGGLGAHGVAIHPSKQFLYVTNSDENTVSLFTIASDGELTEVTPRTNVASGPSLILMDSAGAFLYVANSLSASISVFSITPSSGALTPVAGSPFPLGATPLAMTLNTSGNFLFVTSGVSQGLISVFGVNAGVLSAVGSPVQINQSSPNSLVVDQAGAFLYTGNYLDNTISIFAIDSSGGLTQQVNSPLAINFTGPTALLIDQLGPWLYVANSSNIAGYSLTAGAPTLLTTSPYTATGPLLLAQDPSGKAVFVVSSTSITSYTIDSSVGVGALTSLISVSTGSAAASIAVSN
jgi:6-phosphogluconolactonase